MKKLLIATMAVVLALGMAVSAEATVIAPGGSTVPADTTSPGSGDPILASIIGAAFLVEDAVGNDILGGTYSTWVRQDADGFLVFEYSFTVDTEFVDGDAISAVTMASFMDWTTDVGADDLGTNYPSLIDRSGGGATVRFNYAGDEAVGMGDSSALMWIKTNAMNYTAGSFQLLDGGVDTVAAFAPTIIPEPTSMVLFGTGLLGFAGRMRKKFKA